MSKLNKPTLCLWKKRFCHYFLHNSVKNELTNNFWCTECEINSTLVVPPHLKNVTTLPSDMQNLFTWSRWSWFPAKLYDFENSWRLPGMLLYTKLNVKQEVSLSSAVTHHSSFFVSDHALLAFHPCLNKEPMRLAQMLSYYAVSLWVAQYTISFCEFIGDANNEYWNVWSWAQP